VSDTQTGGPEVPVLARVENGVGRLTLNRPKALNALTTEMCALMTEALLAWREDPAVVAVLLDHAGERGFCAGGDIRVIAESGAGDGREAAEFFRTEYRLNTLLFRYPKPIAAIIDGVTMGGGVGISMPCEFRVATERTLFAMPETGIGLFPDVGGGWYLPRLPGAAGYWLALTGARIRAADCELLGIATDYVESGQVEALKAELVRRPDEIETVLTEFECDPGEPPLAQVQDAIARAFAKSDVEGVLRALRAEDTGWSRTQLETLATKSPQAMKVTHRQLHTGATLQRFEDEMVMEYRLATRACRSHDFLEGVRAVIVDKDNTPHWDPPTLQGVSEARLDGLFAPLPAGEEWTPL
jgi:enoyl-CoA hydratase